MSDTENNTEFDLRVSDDLVAVLIQATLREIPKVLVDTVTKELAKHGYIIGENCEVRAIPDNVMQLMAGDDVLLEWRPMVVKRHTTGVIEFEWLVRHPQSSEIPDHVWYGKTHEEVEEESVKEG